MRNDRPGWPNTPGVGKAVRKVLHKAERRAAREEILYELGELDQVRARGLSNARSEVCYRTH